MRRNDYERCYERGLIEDGVEEMVMRDVQTTLNAMYFTHAFSKSPSSFLNKMY